MAKPNSLQTAARLESMARDDQLPVEWVATLMDAAELLGIQHRCGFCTLEWRHRHNVKECRVCSLPPHLCTGFNPEHEYEAKPAA